MPKFYIQHTLNYSKIVAPQLSQERAEGLLKHLTQLKINKMEEQDIQTVCDDCCDDHTVNVNNQLIGEIFQWLINNDYKICKKC